MVLATTTSGACGGNSGPSVDGGSVPETGLPEDGGDVDGATTRVNPARMWTRITHEMSQRVGLSISDGDRIDVGFASWMDAEQLIVHATPDASGFRIDPVDILGSDSSDSPVAIARDANGVVHMAWTDGTTLRYAVQDGGIWRVETVSGDGANPALVVASDGTPHIAFMESSSFVRELRHAMPAATAWRVTPIGQTRTGGANARVGLAITAMGDPWIAATTAEGHGVTVARRDAAGSWSSVPVHESVERLRGQTSMALDDEGSPVVAFVSEESNAYVAWRSATGWTTELVGKTTSDPWVDVDIAPDSTPSVLTTGDTPFGSGPSFEGMALFETVGGAWSFQGLAGRCEARFSMRLDGGGSPIVAFDCGSRVYLMTAVGLYPADWQQRCEGVATDLCATSCGCASIGEECCWGGGERGGSRCASSFDCVPNMTERLCGDPTVPPTLLDACAEDSALSRCVDDAEMGEIMELSPACAAIPSLDGLSGS